MATDRKSAETGTDKRLNIFFTGFSSRRKIPNRYYYSRIVRKNSLYLFTV
jgi:hypothetical protein